MADIALSTIPGSGNQTSTQSPQSAGVALGGGVSSGSVQPGTASNALETSTGIMLTPTPSSAANLNSSTTQAAVPIVPHRQPNLLLISFLAVLLIIAILLFWITANSGKKHNQY